MEGKGVYRYKHGDSYEGQFLNGAPYGEGKYQYADGSSYQGEFRNLIHLNKHTGLEGSQRLPKCDGWRHGFGVVSICYFDPMRLSWMKGDAINVITAILQFLHIIFCFLSYRAWCFYASTTQQTPQHIAHHSAPTPHTHTLQRTWMSGARYEGQWVEDKMHGAGALETREGARYEGGFRNGLRYVLLSAAQPCTSLRLFRSALFCSVLLCSALLYSALN
jgi:hypothetical protein